MRQLLAIAAIACLILYLALCGLFDMARTASKEGVHAAERRVEEVLE